MSIIVRQALSDSLYLLFKKNESKLLCQVPFADKEGNPLPDEDVEYVTIIEVTKDLLNAGASAIYYVRDEEKFLLPAILSEMSYSSGFSEETKNEVTQILLDSLNEKELSGLIPAHSNMLIQQMLPYEEELNKLLMKGLNFQQDINNHYGSDAIEITAVKRANVNFFLKLAQNSVTLDFEKIYHEGSYNETSLINEVNKLKEKISNFKLDSAEDNQVYETQKNENRKETVTLLEKWILKNKVESMNKSSKIKEGKLKL